MNQKEKIYFLSQQDKSYRGITKIYFNKILKTIIKIGNLEQKDLILDFGCGSGQLKKMLGGGKVIGYDTINEFTDIDDYTKLRPTTIVCSNVLYYLDKEELKETLDNFKKMNKKAKLINVIPTENLISKIGKKLTGFKNAYDRMKISPSYVNCLLAEECNLIKRKYVFTMSEVSLWKFKEGY